MDNISKEKKGMSGLIVLLIVIITILISAPVGYFAGNKLLSDFKLKDDNTEKNNVDDNSKAYYLSANDIDKIKNLFPGFDCELENILENAGYTGVETKLSNGTMIDYITNNINNKDLLDDEKFKFAFAFHIGQALYYNQYNASNAESGTWSISVSNFEEIYKKLFAEDYSFELIPSGTKFELNNNEIIGSIYTGYFNEFYFDLSEKDNSFTASIYNYNYEINNKGETYYGTINLNFDKDENGLYSIKHLYLNK